MTWAHAVRAFVIWYVDVNAFTSSRQLGRANSAAVVLCPTRATRCTFSAGNTTATRVPLVREGKNWYDVPVVERPSTCCALRRHMGGGSPQQDTQNTEKDEEDEEDEDVDNECDEEDKEDKENEDDEVDEEDEEDKEDKEAEQDGEDEEDGEYEEDEEDEEDAEANEDAE